MIFRTILLSLALVAGLVAQDRKLSVGALYDQGEESFFEGKIKEAILDWDREIALMPQRGPHHWQRGLGRA